MSIPELLALKERLLWVITTATNDDETLHYTHKRDRHMARLEALRDVVEALDGYIAPAQPVQVSGEPVAWQVEWHEGISPVRQFYPDKATAERVKNNVLSYKVGAFEPIPITPLYAHPASADIIERCAPNLLLGEAYQQMNDAFIAASDENVKLREALEEAAQRLEARGHYFGRDQARAALAPLPDERAATTSGGK